MSDKKLKCSNCGADFLFTQREQDSYAEKGITGVPENCPQCRKSETECKTSNKHERNTP